MQVVREGGHLPAQCLRSTCKECGGAGICQHQRRRDRCKECGGGAHAGGEHLPAPAPDEHMQGVRGGRHVDEEVFSLGAREL